MVGYRFATEERTLRIEHERCPPLEVELEPWSFRVAVAGREVRFGIGEADLLASHVHAELERERRAGVKKLPLWLVGGHLLELRERGLPRVNPTAAEVIRRLLAVTRRTPRIAGLPELYAEPYVVRDVLRWRAAAIALAFLESDLLADWLRARGPWSDARPAIPAEAAHSGPWQPALAALREWRSLFSPDGRTYRTLDRTLMNLPASVPAKLVCALRRVRLERPLTGRVDLAALLLLVSDRRFGRHGDASAGHARIFVRASDADLALACATVSQHVEQTLDPRRVRDLRTLVAFVLDYPARFHGDLPGLARRAVRWHERRALLAARAAEARAADAGVRDAREREAGATDRVVRDPMRRDAARPLNPAAYPGRRPPTPRVVLQGATKAPPIPLPRHAGVTFLATVEAIEAEGDHMEHCIADYAGEAVDGECYLFHVSHGGCEASVEVDRSGVVRQACGPRNVKNAATRWGARVLGQWGRKLRSSPLHDTTSRALAPLCLPPRVPHPPQRGQERQLSLLLLRE